MVFLSLGLYYVNLILWLIEKDQALHYYTSQVSASSGFSPLSQLITALITVLQNVWSCCACTHIHFPSFTIPPGSIVTLSIPASSCFPSCTSTIYKESRAKKITVFAVWRLSAHLLPKYSTAEDSDVSSDHRK